MTQASTARCTQPGCTGTIMDGYCDVCGSPASVATPSTGSVPAAPAPAAAPARRSGPSVPLTAGRPGACAQPGCTGTVVDGYCDVCGTPGSAAPAPANRPSSAPRIGIATPPPPTSSSSRTVGGVGSTRTRASSRLDSAALGSSRATASGSQITRRVHSGSARLRSARLGAGLTQVPPAPVVDAEQAILAHAEVPEDKRNCPNCGAAVGRSREGRPGRTEGFCPNCRNPFSFTPKLKAGDLVASLYEVAGAIAHGGLCWI